MKKDEIPKETKKNGMIAEIKKDMIRAEMEGGKMTVESKNDTLHQEGGKDIQAGEMKENKTPEEVQKNERLDISDDIEKDINIDVNINNNSSSRIQYTSSITINYYNYEADGQTDSKGRPKKYSGQLPEDFNAKLEELRTATGLGKSELAQTAYELLLKKFNIKQKKDKA